MRMVRRTEWQVEGIWKCEVSKRDHGQWSEPVRHRDTPKMRGGSEESGAVVMPASTKQLLAGVLHRLH